ncbi:MAG: hypothetical protein AB2693_20145 [Candidatus Thiodiazotropha sp.]
MIITTIIQRNAESVSEILTLTHQQESSGVFTVVGPTLSRPATSNAP